MFLHKMMQDMIPFLKEGFEDVWQEIYALSTVRILGYIPLKRVESIWEKLYDPNDLSPNLNPKNLSEVLKEVESDRCGQNIILEGTMQRWKAVCL